ncbi:MAG: cadherin repeat domain-containing protein, partial [Phycisphaerae bacterium]|nr:cadherin repeat domain-containing protein [Phycisphaerae bacterium]
ESASPGDLVGSVRVTDADTAGHTYALTSDADGRFVIDGATGEIRVAPGATFDHETAPELSLTVQVTDGDGAVVERAFTIAVADVSEAPVSVSVDHGTVPGTSDRGFVVGRATATDPDVGDSLHYEVVGGNGAFAVDPETGVITVADPSALRALAGGEASVTVRAVDGDGHAIETTVKVAIDALPASQVPSTTGDDNRAATESGGAMAAGGTEVVVHYDAPTARDGDPYYGAAALDPSGSPADAPIVFDQPVGVEATWNPVGDLLAGTSGEEESVELAPRTIDLMQGDSFDRAFVALNDAIRLEVEGLRTEADAAAQGSAEAPREAPEQISMFAAFWSLLRGFQGETRGDRDARDRGPGKS